MVRLELELARRGGSLFLCTENIGDLQERAGSQRVAHLNGELLKTRCCACEAVMSWRCDLNAEEECPNCKLVGELRPHVVWFGEMPLEMDRVYDALQKADMFVAIGACASAFPTKSLVGEARGFGIRTCEMNAEPATSSGEFDEGRYGPLSEVVSRWVEQMLATLERLPKEQGAISSARPDLP